MLAVALGGRHKVCFSLSSLYHLDRCLPCHNVPLKDICRSCVTSLVMLSNLGARGQAPICGIPSLPRIISSMETSVSKRYKPSRRCLQALADSLMVVDLRAPGPQAVTHLVFASGGSCYVLKSLMTKSDYLHITPPQFHTLDL